MFEWIQNVERNKTTNKRKMKLLHIPAFIDINLLLDEIEVGSTVMRSRLELFSCECCLFDLLLRVWFGWFFFCVRLQYAHSVAFANATTHTHKFTHTRTQTHKHASPH